MDNNAKGLIYAQVDNIRILNYPFFPNTSKDTVFLDDKLKYLVVNKGDQNSPEFTDSCTIDLLYTGYYIKDGKKNIFSTSRELRKPLHFNYGSTLIIKGLTLATNKMRNKEARIVVIPYQLAYGEKGIPDANIPAKTDLIFEIEALKITTKHTKP
jgi:FKBP-type peptidyl-prolyl cis-trans isomerase